MMTFIKDFIKKYVYKFVPPPSDGSIRSYSQAGEDAVINFLFAAKNIRIISYLDVGTNLPDVSNNTFMFYNKGCRGVCVEADRSLLPLIESKRPEDKVLNIGVSAVDQKEAEFYIFNVQGMNTFDKDEALKRCASGKFKIIDTVKVPLKSINHIISENFTSFPDFLSIDIEGLDLEVLKTLDFNSFPIPVICVETCTYSENHIRPKDNCIAEFMKTKGYEIYADTYINTIFVNKDWFYK
jgi:FkbM family methyltransferase